jgi:hypothetical protein
MMTPPKAWTIRHEPGTKNAISWRDDDANGGWRRVYHRTRRRRWWRVIVTRRGSAIRLNHLSAGIRARSRAEPECEHRQCCHNHFLCHSRSSLLSCRFNTAVVAKLPTNHSTRSERRKFLHRCSWNGYNFGGTRQPLQQACDQRPQLKIRFSKTVIACGLRDRSN